MNILVKTVLFYFCHKLVVWPKNVYYMKHEYFLKSLFGLDYLPSYLLILALRNNLFIGQNFDLNFRLNLHMSYEVLILHSTRPCYIV